MIFTPDDIKRIEAEYEASHGATKLALTDRQDVLGWIQELDKQQETLETSLNGIESLETHYGGLVRHWQQMRDETSDKKKILQRDFEGTRRQSIRLQQLLKRAKL